MKDELLMHTPVGGHPIRHLQDILRTVDCIYAAGCGEAPWDRALAEIARVGRLDACVLIMTDRHERRRLVLASYGLSAAEDPMLLPMPAGRLDRMLRSSPGTVWQDRQIGSAPSARPSCTGRILPNGFVSGAAVVVGQEQREVVCLDAYAGAGRPASSPELDDFLRQLAPHLTRAWRLCGASRSMTATPSGVLCRPRCHRGSAAASDLSELSGMARLRAEFGLTKAEARLALRLAEGASVARAAEAFEVKPTTIRSQLQQVFAKTGTSRQAELVALLLRGGHGTRDPIWSPVRQETQSAALEEAGS